MTLFTRLTAIFFTLLLSILITSCGQTPAKDLIIGSWMFEKFEFKGELANIPPTEEKKANEANKGLIIKFSTNYQFSSDQKGSMTINNSNGVYKFLTNDKLIIMGDTVKIIQIDKTYMKLYRNDLSPIVIFRRQ